MMHGFQTMYSYVMIGKKGTQQKSLGLPKYFEFALRFRALIGHSISISSVHFHQ